MGRSTVRLRRELHRLAERATDAEARRRPAMSELIALGATPTIPPGPGRRRFPARAAAGAAGALVLGAVAIAALSGRVSDSADRDARSRLPEMIVVTAPPSTTTPPSPPSVPDTPPPTAPSASAPPTTLPPAATDEAALVVSLGETDFRVGRADNTILVSDWGCAGTALVLVSATSGDVHVFDDAPDANRRDRRTSRRFGVARRDRHRGRRRTLRPAGGGRPARLGWPAVSPRRPFFVGATLAGSGWLLARTAAALAPPPTWRPAEVADWVDERGAAEAAVALVRLVAVGAWAYITLIVTLALLGRIRSLAPLGRLARVLAGPTGRTALDRLIGVGLMTLTAAPLLPTPAASATPAIAGPAAPVEPAPAPDDPSQPPTPGASDDPSQPPTPGAGAPMLRPAAVTDADVVHHVVAPGEHLWAIASDRLDDAWGRPATDAEIVPYWRAVIDANRDRLIVANEPDHIMAGQVFLLPPPGPDPA